MVQSSTFDGGPASSISSKSTSLGVSEVEVVLDEEFDSQSLAPSFEDDSKARNLNGKTVSALYLDLERTNEHSSSLKVSTGNYRVRPMSGNMESLIQENLMMRSQRLENYMEEERRWKEYQLNETNHHTRSSRTGSRGCQTRSEDKREQSTRIRSLLSKAFRK
jgi:hypothetical protein